MDAYLHDKLKKLGFRQKVKEEADKAFEEEITEMYIYLERVCKECPFRDKCKRTVEARDADK